MIDWINIKKNIKKETQKAFISTPSINLDETIDIFCRTLELRLDNSSLKLDGIETRIPNALEKILIDGLKQIDNIAYFIEFAKIEPYLRKILYIHDKNKFFELKSRKAGLAAFINALNLNPNRIDFENDNINSLIGNSDFGEHLYRTYNLRNIESHDCESWTNKELYENIESILIIYLFTTHKFSNTLKSVLKNTSKEDEIDFEKYLNTVKHNFKDRIGKFIHIKGKENINLTQGFVIENINDEESEERERKGTVNDLRKNKVPEKRMLIWGDAGMGKSTTLEYLAYIDADAKLKNANNKLPVYIPLGLLTDKNISLKQSIFNKIGVSENIGQNMLKKGKINLFLDAINEIPKDTNNQLRTLRLREINNIVTEYKNTFIIISNRPEDENIFKGIPVFFLQKMDREQIELFLKRNTLGNSEINKLIINEINSDKRLEKIIRTPLMLSRLIEIIKVKGSIPKSEGEIIDKFILSLYEREKEEKKDANFNIKIIHRLLVSPLPNRS